MLVQQRPQWTCKNPRCFESISFGTYCGKCRKLVIGRKIPDSIICEGCNKEVKVRNLTNLKERKKRFCDDCYHVQHKERSLNYYYSMVRKKNMNKFLEGNV